MTDPWADVREWELGGLINSRLKEVLADADALLAVKRASNDLIEVTDRLARTVYPKGSVGHNHIEGQRNWAYSRWEDALAALPEHLK